MAYTTCLGCLVSTVSGYHKNALGRGSSSSCHITNLSNLLFFRDLWPAQISSRDCTHKSIGVSEVAAMIIGTQIFNECDCITEDKWTQHTTYLSTLMVIKDRIVNKQKTFSNKIFYSSCIKFCNIMDIEMLSKYFLPNTIIQIPKYLGLVINLYTYFNYCRFETLKNQRYVANQAKFEKWLDYFQSLSI